MVFPVIFSVVFLARVFPEVVSPVIFSVVFLARVFSVMVSPVIFSVPSPDPAAARGSVVASQTADLS